MPSQSQSRDNIIQQLSDDITDQVGNIDDDELDSINLNFNNTVSKSLATFHSDLFDDNGFIKKVRDLDLGDDNDKETIKNILNNVRSDYVNVDTMNQSELLMRRDIYNICSQMPEMHDVINIVRDAIIEPNVSTGEVARTLIFENRPDNESEEYESQVKDIEERHDLLLRIKNSIVPKGLMHGEECIQLIPYAKLFAELEAIHDNQYNAHKNYYSSHPEKDDNGAGLVKINESVPVDIGNVYTESVTSLYSDENLEILCEAASPITLTNEQDLNTLDDSRKSKAAKVSKDTIKHDMKEILENIDVYNSSSTLMAENGPDGFEELIVEDYKHTHPTNAKGYETFTEASMNFNKVNSGDFANVDQDAIEFNSYADIKGCYVKYLDGLRLVPIRMDRRVIGYYYVSTTMDLQTNAANPNGIIDLSYQNYTRDRNLVDKLSQMIIRSFGKKMLQKNIKLKNEIADIIMAHKFSEGKLSFIYIPENEVIRIVLNEDEEGRGHSIIEPTLFPARMYLMLTLYNMIYILNNTTTRVHYLKSSGLNKNYSAQVQRTMRKFQQRRITIDDIYSYSGVLNKIGGRGEMVIPTGRSDYKALETDTIPAVDIPIQLEFLEQQRKEAISGTGVPQLLVINAIDEVDFAKTLEMANTRFTSTVSSYKIDFNRGITLLYRRLMKYETDMEDEVINSFKFSFNAIRQSELNIDADMIQNFEQIVTVVESLYYKKTDLEDENGNPTRTRIQLRRKLAEQYLPDLDFDKLDKIVEATNLAAKDDELADNTKDLEITDDDINELKNQ